MMTRTLVALAVAGLAAGLASAQSPKSTTQSIEEYRAMLADCLLYTSPSPRD